MSVNWCDETLVLAMHVEDHSAEFARFVVGQQQGHKLSKMFGSLPWWRQAGYRHRAVPRVFLVRDHTYSTRRTCQNGGPTSLFCRLVG